MMSGSEPGILSSRESFGVGIQKTPITSQPPGIQNMRLAFSADGTAIYKPVTGNTSTYQAQAQVQGGGGSGGGGGTVGGDGGSIVQHSINMNMGEPMKRKRGRPRKYGPDGTMALALTPQTPAVQSGGFPSPSAASPTSSSSIKKARGRPPGSGKKQQMAALGSAGIGFTPHVITVKAGEDVSSKIMSFSQNGPRAVCILSANGAISNVTLRQPATSGGTVSYEGRFEILSLSGSYLLSESGGQRSRTGGLSVSLAGPDGRVLGGGVAGLLTAASPVQVVVGSFIADGRKESKSTNQLEPSSAPIKLAPVSGATVASSPTSRGTRSESSGDLGAPSIRAQGPAITTIHKACPACRGNKVRVFSQHGWLLELYAC